jgi:hypothetical protein
MKLRATHVRKASDSIDRSCPPDSNRTVVSDRQPSKHPEQTSVTEAGIKTEEIDVPTEDTLA